MDLQNQWGEIRKVWCKSVLRSCVYADTSFSGLVVCSEEESGWNLELQGLWQGQGWRCLHLEVSFSTFSSHNE